MELLTPSLEISESYFEALEKGYVDKSRGKKQQLKTYRQSKITLLLSSAPLMIWNQL